MFPTVRKRSIVASLFVLCAVIAAVRFGFVAVPVTNAQTLDMFDPSATITVNDTTDTIHSPGCATTGTGTCSLRDAILFTNAATAAGGGSNTITLGAGTFNLSITGSGENAAATGDLDILAPPTGFINTININGAGASSTIVQWNPAVPAASRDRIIDAHPNAPPNGSIILSISGITFTGGNSVTSSGGVMLTGRPGDITNLTNCIFDSNTALTNGGAISQSSSNATHDLNITNSVFTNNLAGGGGGAVNYNGLGTATITGSTFSNNRTGPVGANTGGDGGALSTSGVGNGGTYNISRNTFINNQVLNATAHGGAVVNANGTLNINFNRFRGNTVPAPANGITLAQTGGASVQVINANDNWWGQNSGPVANDAVVLAAGGTINLTTWLQLRHSASPSAVSPGGTSTLTADLLGRNSGGPTAAGNLTGLPAFPSPATTIFGNPQKGTLSAASTQFINGQATATFTAGVVSTSCGAGGADATVDNQTVNAAVTIQCADLTMTKGNNVANSAVVGQQWTWTLTVTNGGTGNAAFTNGQTILTDNLPNSNVTYGSPTSNNANVSCSISSNNLTCTAAVAGLTLAPAASFTVTLTATGTAPATNINPRAAGIARIDSGSLIVESNEGNNDASANTVTVSKANTSMSSISDSPDPSVVGQAYTVGFTLNVTAPGSGTPTGTVSVNDGTGGMCTATLPTMNCMLTSTTQGVKTVTLTYNGDSNFNTSGNTAGHLVNKASTSVGIVSSQNPSLAGQNVTFTATANVTAPGAGTPTGSITFLDNAVAITGCTNVALTGVTAQCTPSPTLALGNHPITAQYNGDTNFNTGSGTLTGNPQVVTNTAVWDGSASGDWNTAANWTTNFVPLATHDVSLPSSGVTNQPNLSAGDTTVPNLTVGANRTLTIGGNRTLTVTGTLTMNGLNIDATAGLLEIGGAGTIVRTSGAVLGPMRKVVTSAPIASNASVAPESPAFVFVYPVGTATGFSPVTANFTAGSGSLTVSANNGTAPSTPALNDATTLDRYWQITETGDITASLTFSYLDPDVDGTEANYRLIRTAAGSPPVRFPNGCPGSPCVDAAANTIFANPVSSFNNFWTAGEPLAPTAANVGVSGRVLTSEGRGVSKARVTLNDASGNIVYAITNPFGYYRFVNVAVGETYLIVVTSKQYQFTPRLIQVSDELTGVDFIADPEN